MQLLGSLIVFVLFIFLYLIIVEVFVMLFRITGLPDEKARFQVVSMLTNSGYTTREAELITNSKQRRKLARAVMMFGYAFTVTIVSTVVNIFVQFSRSLAVGSAGAVPVIAVIILLTLLVRNSPWVKRMVDRIIKAITMRMIRDKNSNHITIVDEYGKLVIARIDMNIVPEHIADRPLGQSKIRSEHKIIILLKHTDKGEVVATRDTSFKDGDVIVVMGEENKVRSVFELRKQSPDSKAISTNLVKSPKK